MERMMQRADPRPEDRGVLWGDVGALAFVVADASVSRGRIGRAQRRAPDHLEVWLMQVACHNASDARARFRPRPAHCKLIRADLRQRRAEVAASLNASVVNRVVSSWSHDIGGFHGQLTPELSASLHLLRGC
jgi:hypothetical protein